MMNRIGTGFAIALIFATVFPGAVFGIDIGRCSLDEFIFGGHLCLRTMMSSLKDGVQCNTAYETLTGCVDQHVDGCVKDTVLSAFQNDIVKLLLIEAYHCGNNDHVNVTTINDFLLDVIKCAPKNLTTASSCWDEFDSAFVNNRGDSQTLCKKYAAAKRQCVLVARRACEGLCPYMTVDAFNPFCSNSQDERDQNSARTEGCSELHQQCTKTFIYEKAMECDDEGAELFAEDSSYDCSVEKTRSSDCLKSKLGRCSNLLTPKTRIMDLDVERALHGMLTTRRIFCENTILDANVLSSQGRFLINCNADDFKKFAQTADDCAKTFREAVAADSSSQEQKCSDYSEARICKNDAQETHCSLEVNNVTSVINNPFCTSGLEGANSPELQLLVLSIVFLLSNSINI